MRNPLFYLFFSRLESASRSVPIRPVESAVDDRFLPNITRTHAHPDGTRAAAAAHGETDGRRAVRGEVDEFTWEKPMPPAPGTESHRHSRSGGHHCEYTRLLKKGMHTHTSVSITHTHTYICPDVGLTSRV